MTNDKIDKNAVFDPLFLFNGSAPESLIIKLFDLGKLFVDKKMVTFTALGTCMYPCIRQGDIIYIQPKNVGEIQVGEVTVYRRNNRLFSHRAIAKGIDEDRAYVITRPDTAKYGDDGPTFNGDILGVVAQLERRGKKLKPIKRHYNLIEKIWLGLCLKCFYFKQFFLEKIIFLTAFLQQAGLYRLVAGIFSKNLNKDITFIFSILSHGRMTDKFYRNISEEELQGLISDNNDGLISKWTIALKINSKEAASMSFLLRSKSHEFCGWWLVGAEIRIRHRGTVVEKALLDKVDSLLKQAGISDIFASVFRKPEPERMFLKGLGFKPIHAHIMRRKIACSD
jgi:hypothetical protein